MNGSGQIHSHTHIYRHQAEGEKHPNSRLTHVTSRRGGFNSCSLFAGVYRSPMVRLGRRLKLKNTTPPPPSACLSSAHVAGGRVASITSLYKLFKSRRDAFKSTHKRKYFPFSKLKLFFTRQPLRNKQLCGCGTFQLVFFRGEEVLSERFDLSTLSQNKLQYFPTTEEHGSSGMTLKM